MKKILWSTAGILTLATLAWVQVTRPARRELASLMPAGPMIYLEAKDFHSLLADWNGSNVKQNWLTSANYSVFSNSNLLQKLQGLYQEYGNVAGFLPGIPGTLEITGRESALGLYEFTEQQFVYITRVDESQLTASQLWRLREKFTVRQASGISFYMRRDDASHRTVAFAYIDGWLVLSTRDDLMANTLALIAGQTTAQPATRAGVVRDENVANLASETWYTRALAQAGTAGELRMALNMHALVSDVRFRSYWIQRNISELRPFEGEIVDVQRTQQEIDENRILVRLPEQQVAVPSSRALDAMAALRAIAPADGALALAWAEPSSDMVESLIENRLLKPGADIRPNGQYAPEAVSTDTSAGTEQDLETRIDEPALASAVGGELKSERLRQLIAGASPEALLQIGTSATTSGFIRTPTVLVISAPVNWDANAIRTALTSAIETLWSTSQLGVGWQATAMGSHAAEQLNGLATLEFAIDGKLLYLANDPTLLLATLNRAGAAPLPSGPAYAAEFHHARERADYLTIMRALDFGGHPQTFLFVPQGNRTPQFFSENLPSLSSVFSFIQSMTITRVENPNSESQRVVYR
jgi:hypothetical protein